MVGQPAEVSQVVTHLLDEFCLLIQEVVLQEVTEVSVCVGRTQGMQIQKDLAQVLLQGNGSFHGILSGTPLILGRLHHILEEGSTTALVWHLQEPLGSLSLRLGQLLEEVAHTLQSPILAVEIEAQTEVGVGGLQMQGDWAGRCTAAST